MASLKEWLESVDIEDGELQLHLTDAQSSELQEKILAAINGVADSNPQAKQEIVDKVIIPTAFKYAKGYIIAAAAAIFIVGYTVAKMRK